MQSCIPIKQLAKQLPQDADVWDRKHDLNGRVFSPQDFLGRRHDYCYLDTHRPENHVHFPQTAVQPGHGHGHGDDMNHNNWFAPQEQKLMLVDGAPTFEVQVDVSEFKPEELNVRFNERERVLTIEGQHSEHHKHYEPRENGLVSRRDSVRTQFKRSVTLPEQVLDSKLECNLSADGHQMVLTAPIKTRKLPALALNY